MSSFKHYPQKEHKRKVANMGFFKKSEPREHLDPDIHAPPLEDEQGLVREVDWTREEEKKAKRK